MILHAAPVSLVDLITGALSDARSEAEEKQVRLAWTVDPSLPPYVSVKRVDLPSIVLVLIRRALCVAQGAMLHLTIASSGKDRVIVQLEDEGTSKSLDVKLWQQLLYWVEDFGGKATRDSSGLFWTVILPLDASQAEVAQLSPTKATRGQLSVLVASSDTDVRAKVLEHLKAAGHSTLECRTQLESIALCQQYPFDLVLLDSDLPGGGGLPLAKALRVAAPDQRLIALLSTGIPQAHSDFAWVKLWMHKPPRESELKLALEVALIHRRDQIEEAKSAREARASIGA
jgi:CheY-like chemotaxis protein